MTKPALQRARLLAQMGFFTLFTVTPIFDLFRYDLTERHAYFLTMPWHLGIDELIAGTGDAKTAAINIILFLFLPVLGTLGLIIVISGLFIALGGLHWEWTWVIVIMYFTCIHSTLVMFGAYALSKALAGQTWRYPLIGPAVDNPPAA